MSEAKTISDLLSYVDFLLRHREPQRALNVLTKQQSLLCDSGQAWQLRGQAHYELCEFPEALAALEHASLLVPLLPEAQCRLAECYLRARQRDLANVIYRHLATLEMLPEETAPPIARGLATSGELGMSLNFCLAQLRRFGGNHELHFVAATVMQRLGCHSEDIYPFIFQAHHLRPDVLPYRISFAQHLVALDRHQDAEAALTAVDLDRVACIASLERLRQLFLQLGNEDAEAECHARLAQIGYERSATWRPNSDES